MKHKENIRYKELLKDYDSLQDRFQKLWFENHSIKELNIKLQDKIEELEDHLRYQQELKYDIQSN